METIDFRCFALHCEVSLNTIDCTDRTDCVCFSCGKPACAECSTIATVYFRWRDKRICLDCQEDRSDEIDSKRIVLAITPPPLATSPKTQRPTPRGRARMPARKT